MSKVDIQFQKFLKIPKFGHTEGVIFNYENCKLSCSWKSFTNSQIYQNIEWRHWRKDLKTPPFYESIVVVQVISQYRAVHDKVLLIHDSTKSEGVFSISFELTLSTFESQLSYYSCTYESAQIKLLVDFLTLKALKKSPFHESIVVLFKSSQFIYCCIGEIDTYNIQQRHFRDLLSSST